MNYSKKFNTTKKAIAEIKRLEKECARLAGQLSNANIILKGDSNIKEISRLKSEAVQFRNTQDYQSDKIGELLEEVVHYKKCYKRVNNKLVIIEDKFEDTYDAKNKQKKESDNILKEALFAIEKGDATIIRQANELTELKAGV